jgi:serine/threonine-protein kinase SRPK3
LFDSFRPTADRVTAEQVEVLGILPHEWWGNWHRRLEWFNEEGELDLKPETSRGHDGVRRTWDLRFDYCIQEPRAEAGLEIVMERERRAFEAMLRPMLTFRPRERATAQQALHSEWMKGWGQPALEESLSTYHSVMRGTAK